MRGSGSRRGAGVARLGEAQEHQRLEPRPGPARTERAWNRRPRAVLALICASIAALVTACTADDPAPAPAPTRSGVTSSAAPAPAAYHLDCSAAEPGDGSGSRPWNSPADVTAHGPFLPGEQLLLRRGSVCHGRLAPDGSGTNGAPIVLGAYGTGAAPVVSGDGTPDQTGAVQLTDQHDWVVQDLDVTNLDPAGPDDTLRAGILVVDDGGDLGRIVIRRNAVRRVTSSPAGGSADPHEFGGIVALVRGRAVRSAALSDVRIEDNRVDRVGRIGIVAWSDAWPSSPLRGVSITGNQVTAADGDSIIVWGVDGGTIEHNTAVGGGRLPPCPRCSGAVANTASAGIWPVMSTRILVRYNEVSGVGAGGGDGQGLDIDDATSSVVVEGNYSHDNEGGGILICGARDSVVRSNVFANSGGGEITFSCPKQRDGVEIVDNTFLLAAGSSAQVVRHNRTAGDDPVLFADNIVIDLNGGGYAWPMPVEAENNIYAGRVPVTGPDDATTPVDPGLVAPGTGGNGLDSVSGYRPTAGSAAAGGGTASPGSGPLDYFGMTRTGAQGRGAIGATVAPPALAPAVPAVVRSGNDVAVSWTADRGSAWRVQRSVAREPFVTVSGVVTGGAFVDAAPPVGPLRYRLVQVGRDADGRPSAPVPAG